jgi:hypothetical protein
MITILERTSPNTIEITEGDHVHYVRNDDTLGRVFEGSCPVSVEIIVQAANMLNETYDLEPRP